MLTKKLDSYFNEAKNHINKIDRAKEVLKNIMPLDIKKLSNLSETEQDKLDILAFRFAKLQDLLGDKIFKNILQYSGYNIQKPFVEILSELEREGFLNLNLWLELRDARNAIAHDYPEDDELKVEAINFIFENSSYLSLLTQKLEDYYNEIKQQRETNN